MSAEVKRSRRRSIFASSSIDEDKDSSYRRESIKRKKLDLKMSTFKNVWEKNVRIKREARLANKHKTRILRWKKVNNPENKEQMKHITKHMTKENAELFKQLFKNLVN